ncbi:MAG: hypothetical protein EKK39_08545 [Sphingobacteriales bacterium]|uniref:hypothetical protein n=1 Tax=Hydrotalea flava TaxID=714549 RepID=UPI00083009BE|nr:hypothetical protein [Hydrotalea flava]RTL50969.1 MAG: hypothetical protein EKK39_08545 [Sphingobacteriales bacterium]
MKTMLTLAVLAFLLSCNQKNASKVASTSSVKDSMGMAIQSPYPILYSSNFTMGNPKNAENLLMLWKDWDDGNLLAHRNFFADSVTMFFADGSSMHSSSDSALAHAQRERNNLTSSVSTINAIIPVKSVDKNENWALIWGKEVDTDKKGKKDSAYVQETWRFNKDGKVDLFYQFKAAGSPPKKS